jgi:plastocyanin
MRRTAWAAAAAAALLALSGCGGSNDNGSGQGSGAATPSTPTATDTPAASSGGGASVPVAADPGGALAFTEKTLSAKAGKVTFDFTNKSQVPHAVAIEGNGVDVKTEVVTGANASVTADLKPGKYTFYCPVDQHRQAGMEGTLTVS